MTQAPETAPEEVWQHLHPPGTFPDAEQTEHTLTYPATLPDGRQIVLPIRPLPDSPDRAVASLIILQASFAVEDALTEAMAKAVAKSSAEIVLAVPSLGLTLANGVARRLGHTRMAALGTTRKFWYDDALSEPSSSISSRAAPKTLYLDPRTLPLIAGRRVAIVDDVISTGSSLLAVLRLLRRCDVRPVIAAAAMLQSDRWRRPLAREAPEMTGRITGVFRTPLLARAEPERWRAIPAERARPEETRRPKEGSPHANQHL